LAILAILGTVQLLVVAAAAHGLHGFFAAQGLQGLQPFLAAHGLHGLQERARRK
jgi:hypothetical protein